MSDDIQFLSRDYATKTVIRWHERKAWYEYLECETSTIRTRCDERDLDTLIDLALDLGDYDWFKRLSDKKNTLLVSKMIDGPMVLFKDGEYLILM
jgi:hypothetical protein